jgi:hypothetical protein
MLFWLRETRTAPLASRLAGEPFLFMQRLRSSLLPSSWPAASAPLHLIRDIVKRRSVLLIIFL